MKLTIKSAKGLEQVVNLEKDLQFTASKGEQYIFSKGFSNYILNFKDDQKSLELTFNVDGKTVKVDLKGIVPYLQENTSDSTNPTAVIINKNINDKDLDTLFENSNFNGSEIIDRLEALISKPVELGNSVDNSNKLTLISDFQTLIEALDAAAAGGANAGGATSNGSTFNSIFSSLSDSLNGIADTDVWENLSESISNIPVDTGNEVGPTIVTPINVNVKLIGINTNVTEGENATYKVTLTDDAGNPIIALENTVVTFTYTYITVSGDDIIEVGSVIILAGSSEALVEIKTIDDDIYEISEEFTIEINTVSNQGQFGTVTVDKTPILTVINDEDDNNPDTPDVPTDGDKPTVKIVATDAVATEGTTDTATFTISQTNTSNFDTTVDVKLNLTDIVKEDISKVEYTDANGVKVELTSAQIDALVAGTFEVVIPKGSIGTPSFTFTATDDDIYEISEGFGLSISNAQNATLGANTATAVINDEDDNNPDTPDVPTDGDKPILIITGSTVEEKESGISTGEKVIGTVEISISNGKVFTEDLNITLSTGQIVTIKAGEATTGPINVETNRIDDYYKQGTTTYDVSIREVSNSKIDIAGKTASITVKDDIDPIGIEITATATAPKIIDVNTKFDEFTGVKISATDTDGNSKNISVVKNTNHDGFGVEGQTTGSGDSTELGNLGNGKSEKLVVEFDKDVNSLDIAFAWRNNGETARITFINDNNVVGYAEVKGGGDNTKANVNYYTQDGELIKSVEAQGGTDRVDLSYTFELPNTDGSLVSFDRIEFTAPNHNDDYLINKISYKEVVDPEITDVSADGGSVTFDIQIDEKYPPQGNATAKIEVNGVIYDNVIINATGRATLTVDGNDLGDLSNVVIKVLEINGGNYEKVNSAEETFDFTPVLKSSDDSITTNEDESYILKVTDFGEVSVNTKEFKITELPNPESGKLYLLVKQGETIIDKEGNISIATQDTKVEIFENQIIKLADVGAEKVIFEPKANSDIDGDFKFKVGDAKGTFSDEYTTVIQILAVADKPTASIDVTKIASSGTEYKVDISAALADADGSEILTVKIGGVPEGAILSSDLYTLVDNGDKTWSITIPAGIKSITDSIIMNVPESQVNNIKLEITARGTETNDNTDGQNFAEVVINDKQDAPEIEIITVSVSEEGLLNGIKDADGIVDTTDETKITGTIKITDANNDIANVTLVAPSSDLKSNGQVIVWTLNNTEKELIGKVGTIEVVKVVIDNNGKYSVELLSPVDHPVNSVEDIVSLDVGVKVIDSLGNISNGKIVVNIEDDMPKSCSVTNEIDIQKDVVVVKNLEAGFKDSIYLNGTNEVTNTNTDGDTLIDRIQWGTPADSNNGQSGYNLVDSSVYTNSIGTQIDTNGAFKLADFTHQNWTIDGKSSTLDKTTITMKMDVVINGKAASVEFDVLLDHDETPNTDDTMASRDIITLPENDITINVDGQNYTFTVEGFRNSSGEYVKTIYTNETSNNNFEIYASIKQAVELPVISGNVCADAGADGLASVTWENLNSQYGTMSVDANGGYVFTVNQTTKDNLEIGESLTQEFTYTIMDKDGDKSTNTVTIKINGIAVPNAIPTTTDDMISTNEDTSKVLTLSDFGTYNDANGDILSAIKISTLPTNGVLTLNGVAIGAGVVISASDISNNKLVFTPTSNTDLDSSFTFQVSDGREWSSTHTTSIEVIAVADKPTASIDVEFVKEVSVGNICPTSQDLGNLIAFLNNQGNISADVVASLVKDQNGNPMQDQYNLELTSLGEAELLLYDNVSNQNSTRDINKIDLSDTSLFDSSTATIVTNTVNNTYNMTTNKIIFEGNIIQNGNVQGTAGNDVIIVKGEIQGGSNINAGSGNDLIALFGDIGANQPAIDGGNGIDILYLSKAASHYYFSDIHFHDNLDGHIVDKDTGKTLTFNNIEGIAFGDGTGINCQTVTSTQYEYSVNISAALTDKDGSETLTVKITNVPTGATFDTTNIVDKGNGIWELTIPSGATSISDSLKMTVPLSAGNFELGITARATETNDNTDGLNYKESTDSDAIVYAIDETNTLVIGNSSLTTNIVITLDISKSMDDKVDGDKTRLDIAKAAVKNMLDSYSEQGTVNIKLITFSTEGKSYANWMTLSEAKNIISNLKTDAYTNYEDAVYETYNNYTEPVSDRTVAYFISDGVPTAENKNSTQTVGTSTNSSNGIDNESGWFDTSYKMGWNNFVTNYVDELYVVGVGSGISNYTHLNTLASAGDNAVVKVTDDTKLNAALQDLITYTISGDVTDNLFGGDGVKTIKSIVVDGNEYTKTTFPIDGIALDGDGKLVFNFDTGTYTYNGKSSEFTSDITKTFKINVSDVDGDKESFDVNLKIDITPNETITTLNTSDEDTIDLTSLINSNISYKNDTDVIDMTNDKIQTLKIDMDDVIDLVDADKQLVIKGDLQDKVQLDTPNDWSNVGKEQLDGTNYKVFTGTGINSTIKLLIEDDIDVTPDI